MKGSLHRTDGDGWVDCTCGQRHWGHFGAGGLLLADPELGVLLQHRALWSHHGGTWGVPGGAIAAGESALHGALREAAEEAAVEPSAVRPTHAWEEDHGPWSYTTVVAERVAPVEPRPSDPESLDIAWVPVAEVDTLPLLPAFGARWPRIRDQLHRRLRLIVDAANVVGSRPDGWWRDRAGATSRLRDQLAGLQLPAQRLDLPATTWWPDVELVVEGAARSVHPVDDVAVRRAEGSGDDAIVAAASDAVSDRPGDHVVVVTADRDLRRRVQAVGAGVTGPSTLWDALR